MDARDLAARVQGVLLSGRHSGPPGGAYGPGKPVFEACGTGDAFSCGTGTVNSTSSSCGTVHDGSMMPQYVGSGKGAYLQVSTFRYVGDGAGEFDVVEEPSTCRPRVCLCLCLGILAALAAVAVWRHHSPDDQPASSDMSATDWGSQHRQDGRASKGDGDHWTGCNGEAPCTSSTKSSSSSHAEAALTFDCVIGYSSWEDGWIKEKKEYCCRAFGRGCEKSMTHAKDPGFDCKAGLDHLDSGWSDEKRVWCCARGEASVRERCQRGDKGNSSGAEHFDCGAGDHKKGWSRGKKEYCCRHAHIGCHRPTHERSEAGHHHAPSVSIAYDCSAGLSVWRVGWSLGKQSWCCKHRQLGCVDVAEAAANASGSNTSALANNVSAHNGTSGSSIANASGSPSREAALNETRANRSGKVESSTKHNTSKASLGHHNKGHAAPHENRSSSDAQAYDCENSAGPQSGWSPGHKAWCCLYQGKACPKTLNIPS